MPTMPPTRCTYPGCGQLSTHAGRCDTHQRPPWQMPSQHTQKIDTSKWMKVRALALYRDHGQCVACGAPATEVDHITEVADGGDLYSLSNCQSLCHSCHAAKTQRERRARAARRRAERLRLSDR